MWSIYSYISPKLSANVHFDCLNLSIFPISDLYEWNGFFFTVGWIASPNI